MIFLHKMISLVKKILSKIIKYKYKIYISKIPSVIVSSYQKINNLQDVLYFKTPLFWHILTQNIS